MPIRVGIDLVRVEEVQNSLEVHGQRYLERIYTEEELRACGSDPRRLAARFAAKEATMKALGRGDEGMDWRSIEVRTDDDGRDCLRLTGGAAELARERGVAELRVSLTHQRDVAAAVVLAELNRHS